MDHAPPHIERVQDSGLTDTELAEVLDKLGLCVAIAWKPGDAPLPPGCVSLDEARRIANGEVTLDPFEVLYPTARASECECGQIVPNDARYLPCRRTAGHEPPCWHRAAKL